MNRRIPTIESLDKTIETIKNLKDKIAKEESHILDMSFIDAVVNELIRSYEYIFSLEIDYEYQANRKDKIIAVSSNRLKENNKLSERLRYVRETNKHLWEKIKLLKFALKECQQKDCDPIEMLQPYVEKSPWQTDGDRMKIVYTNSTERNPYWPLDYETNN